MARFTIQHAFDLALQHHQAGRLQEAEQLYRQILAQQPQHADAMHHLGVIAQQVGRNDVSVDLIRRAIALGPNCAEAHSNLGNALKDTGQLDEAIAAYRQALALNPNLPEAHNNLGIALKGKGQFDEAITAYHQALALRPNYAEAYNNLGNALREKRQLDEAMAAYRQALVLRPGYAEAHSNLAIALTDKGELDEAISAARQAIALNPNLVEAHNHLGNALKDEGRLDEAVAAYRQALALRPNYAEAHNNLGNALRDNGQLDEAIAACRQAIALRPNYAEAHNNLGNALKDVGQLDEAIAAFRRAIAIDPDDARVDSNLVFTMHFHCAYDARTIAEELRRWNHRHAEPLRKSIQFPSIPSIPSTGSGQASSGQASSGPATSEKVHSNDRRPDRRLRIGYVSADFRDHVVGQNLLPLFHHHDRRQFEITCYAQAPLPDALTRQLQQNADCWRNIVGLGDADVAKQICEDRIDILVDLALHSSGNRLLVFARKPAPVQVSYLGYCGSTGMSAMDYRLSDPYLDPPGADLSCYAEKTLHLPRSYWCYQPGPAPDPSPAPAMKSGAVTFGCLNNFAKVSTATLDLWARILAEAPNSRMVIHAPPGRHRDDAARRLLGTTGAGNRVTFVAREPRAKYAQTYSQIDIALDPFPFGGGMTTCDALWMGVPVVSLSGASAIGRGGRSILSNLGLAELIAFTPDQYVQIALDLARDRDRLDGLRRGMRARMLASPLMDAGGFARDVEAAYRLMWREWCDTVSACG